MTKLYCSGLEIIPDFGSERTKEAILYSIYCEQVKKHDETCPYTKAD
jgi:hypothetical protein